MPNDALVINRAADLPDLLAKALYGLDFYQMQREAQAGNIDAHNWYQATNRLLDALGVGQPEPVTATHLRLAAASLNLVKALLEDLSPAQDLSHEAAARIERVLGGKKP